MSLPPHLWSRLEMRSSLLLCLLLSLWAIVAQPMNDRDKMVGVWSCLGSPASNTAERRFVERVGEYVKRWPWRTTRISRIYTLKDLVYAANCDAAEDGSEVGDLQTREWERWLQLMADLIYTFWCVRANGVVSLRCQQNVVTVFGRQPKQASQKVLDVLYDRACLEQRRADLEFVVAGPSQLAGVIFERYMKNCAVAGIKDMREKRPGGRPEHTSSSGQPAQKEEEEAEDGSWFSRFSIPPGITSLGKSVGHVLNSGYKSLQLPAPMRGLPKFGIMAP